MDGTAEITLSDLGERRLLSEIIPRFASAAGDDCAIVGVTTEQIVITTDPVPRPAAEVIAGDGDPFWAGWLLVTINASDIAASGARPLAFVAALDLPPTMPVAQFERLLEGIKRSCEANGLAYVGGNLRETKGAFAATGTAIGMAPVAPLTRRGARSGDHLVVIGRSGRFWSDALFMKTGQHARVCHKTSPLFAPVSQARNLWRLHEQGLIAAAMDTSDGLAPTLEELARVNALQLEVDLAAMRRACPDGPDGERPERAWFGWGDWTVAAVVHTEKLEQFGAAADQIGAAWTRIARFVEGPTEVQLVDGSRRMRAQRLESERFVPDSWFSQGIDAYIERLRTFPLP
jgi:thiamine-monophosphate kinase